MRNARMSSTFLTERVRRHELLALGQLRRCRRCLFFAAIAAEIVAKIGHVCSVVTIEKPGGLRVTARITSNIIEARVAREIAAAAPSSDGEPGDGAAANALPPMVAEHRTHRIQ